MAGTWLDTAYSVPQNNYVYVRNYRAYEEGVQYRLGGTVLERPSTDNPFTAMGVDDPQFINWDLGWKAAHGDGDGTNGFIDPCSSYTGQTAAA